MTKYPIEVFWSDEDEGYIAVVPDLAGCNAWGKTDLAHRRAMGAKDFPITNGDAR